MPGQERPTNRGRLDRSRLRFLSGHEEAEHQILMSSRYCAICNLTFGSQERRVLWDEKAAHPGCARRVRGLEAA